MTTEVNKEALEAYLQSDEGKAFIETQKEPLLNKRDELLGQLTSIKEELNTYKKTEEQRLADIESAKRTAEEQRLRDEKDFSAYKTFHEQEIEKYQKELGTFKSKYAEKEAERLIADTAAKYSKSPAPLKLLLRERVKSTINEDGNIEVNVLDDKGETMYWEGKPASVDHLVEHLKADEQYSPFFVGTGKSGSGTQQSVPATAAGQPTMDEAGFNLTAAMKRAR